MARLSPSAIWVQVLLILLVMGVIVSSVEASGDHHGLSWLQAVAARTGGCGGSIAECMVEDEYDMESGSSRRILATSDYISYGALRRNTVPCTRKGASYYNCQPGAEANPYTRDCSAIARCRS